MHRWSVLWKIVVTAMMLVGCAGGMGGGQDVNYANSTGNGNVILNWNCTKPQPNVLQVNGTFDNTTMAGLQEVTIQIVGIGPSGAQVSSGQGTTSQWIVTTMSRTPFQVTVNTTGTESKFNMLYSYRVGSGLSPAGVMQYSKENACPGLQ